MLSLGEIKYGRIISWRKSSSLVLIILSVLLIVPILSQLASAAEEQLTVTKLDSQRSVNMVSPSSLVARDGYMFEPDYGSGSLKITDVSDPYNPVITFAEGEYMNEAYEITRVGDEVYVYSEPTNNNGRITSFDISDPENVTQMGAIDISTAALGCNNVSSIYSADGAVVADVSCSSPTQVRQLLVIDVADPAAMTIGDSVDYSTYGQYVRSIQRDGQSVYVYFTATTLYVELNLSDKNSISVDVVAPWVGPSSSSQIQPARVGDNIYMPVYVGGSAPYYNLTTIDVSNPSSPSVVATTMMCRGYGAVDLWVANSNRLIATCTDQLFDVDISNPLAVTFGDAAVTLDGYAGMDVDEDLKVYQNASFENMVTEQVYDASVPGVAPAFLGANVNHLTVAYNSYIIIPEGSSTGIVFKNDLPVVKTIDVSDPNNMEITGTQFLQHDGKLLDHFSFGDRRGIDVSADGKYIYITEDGFYDSSWWQPELNVLDVSDPNNISVVERLKLPASDTVSTGEIIGNTWYVVTGNTLKTFSINPSTGQVTALDEQAFTRPSGGTTSSRTNIAIVNDTAILTFGVQSIRHIDVSDPSNLGAPVTANLPAFADYRYISQPLVTGNHILVTVGGSTGTIAAIDASNPSAMTISSSISDSIFREAEGESMQIYQPGVVLFGGYEDGSFAKIDITDPSNLQIIEKTGAAGLFPDALDGWEGVWEGMALVGDHAFGIGSVSDGNYYSFNIADLNNPKPLDIITEQIPLWMPQSVHVAGDTLYTGSLTDWEINTNLVAYDVSGPGGPTMSGTSVHEFTSVMDMVSSGDRLFAARDYDGLGVYDITNRSFPILTALATEAWSATSLALSGDTIYMSDESQGLLTYDISNPDSPSLLSTFEDSNFTGLESIQVAGDYVYGVMKGDNKVVIIDVSNPSAPSTVSTITDTQFAGLSKLKVSDNLLYVADAPTTPGANDSLTIFNLDNPTSPTKLGQYVAPSQMGYGDIELYGEYAFVAAATANQIDILDVSDPVNPVISETISDGSELQGVKDMTIANNRLYAVAELGQTLNTYSLALGAVPGNTEQPPVTGGGEGGGDPSSPPSAPNTGVALGASDYLDVASKQPLIWIVALLGLISFGTSIFLIIRKRSVWS